MSNFPLIQYKNFEQWIPETDIDGIDAKPEILSSVSNVDFGNGFIETSKGRGSAVLPSLVSDDIRSGDYDLLSSKKFTHSAKGDNTVYVLWDKTSLLLKVYINNTLLSLDEMSLGITYLQKPNNINYNLVNDQLKINLNCKARIGSSDDIILNLTLVYLKKVEYTSTFYRDEGWYLTPRWLGAGMGIDNVYLRKDYPEFGSRIERFDISQILNIPTLGGGDIEWGDGMFSYNDSSSSRVTKTWFISELKNLKRLKLKLSCRNIGTYMVSGDERVAVIKILIFYGYKDSRNRTVATLLVGDDLILKSHPWSSGSIPVYYNVRYNLDIEEFIVDEFSLDDKFILQIEVDLPPRRSGSDILPCYVGATVIIVEPMDVSILGLYNNSQRALISRGDYDVYMMSDSILLRVHSPIDYRITSYEVYAGYSSGHKLIGTVPVIENRWRGNGYVVWSTITHEDDSYISLAERYNLTYKDRVDNQRLIYSEVSHKGRVYFVNGDYKIYQSHILPNLAIQADSFPYNEEIGFGYNIVSHSKFNKALAVSPTNDLVVFTNDGIYLLLIQSSSFGSYKQLRLLDGSVAVGNINSITRSLDGEPPTDGLIWNDENGIYYYVGGINPPVNMIMQTHEKYWESLNYNDKVNAVGFYNKITREYLLNIGSTVIVVDVPYRKLKVYSTMSFDEFIGYSGNVALVRSFNSLYTVGTGYGIMSLSTHYGTCYSNDGVVPEIYGKILNDVYIVFGSSEFSNVYIAVYCDDRLLGTYPFRTDKQFDKWIVPIIRFNRIKLVLYADRKAKIRIKEFGCHYILDDNEQLAAKVTPGTESGYGGEFGKEFGA